MLPFPNILRLIRRFISVGGIFFSRDGLHILVTANICPTIHRDWIDEPEFKYQNGRFGFHEIELDWCQRPPNAQGQCYYDEEECESRPCPRMRVDMGLIVNYAATSEECLTPVLSKNHQNNAYKYSQPFHSQETTKYSWPSRKMTTGSRLYFLCLGVSLMFIGVIKYLNESKLSRYLDPSWSQGVVSSRTSRENLWQNQSEKNLLLNVKNKKTTHKPVCPDLKPVTLQWHQYSAKASNLSANVSKVEQIHRPAKKRLLVGLTTGYDAYAQLLDLTGRINKAYALKFEHDVLVLAGTYLVIPSDNCNPPKHRATFNKIGLLKHALRHRNKYDQLLILDTDAMMYNLSFDVTTLVSEQRNENSMLTDEESTMLVAHRVKKNGTLHTWDVNIGVTLWNLHHHRTQFVAKEWERVSRKALAVDAVTSDQSKLHAVLRNESKYIHALKEEFAYGHGSVVRHYIRRRSSKGWKDPDVLTDRLMLLQEAAEEVCHTFPTDCQSIDEMTRSD